MNYVLNSDKKEDSAMLQPCIQSSGYKAGIQECFRETGTVIKLLPKIINLLRTIRILNKKK